jgi:hypothetical protein
MLIDSYWFNNTQNENEILQPDFFVPKTHLGVYAELETLEFPVCIDFTAIVNGSILYEKQFTFFESENSIEEKYDVYIIADKGIIIGSIFTENTNVLPEHIKISINSGDKVYSKDILCEYAILSGKITDFTNKPFPAAFKFYRESFGGGIGVWSNKDGEYSITIPQGIYNAFYVDDNSYRKTSLENWSWHMIVDRNETHDFKIGTGEVYSLCVWVNNGGFSTLFIYFRPMILHKSSQYQVEINANQFNVTDKCPELNIEDITVTLNGYELKKLSLQKIFETSDKDAMPAYILQVKRRPESKEYFATGKQTLIVEYNSNENYTAQSQGRTQFFYKDVFALSLM